MSYIGKELGILILKRATTLYIFLRLHVKLNVFPGNKSNSLNEEKCIPCVNSTKFLTNGDFVPSNEQSSFEPWLYNCQGKQE